MIESATAINSLSSHAMQDDFETIELSVSEFESILKDSISIYNEIAETLRDCGTIRGKELARMTAKAQDSLKAAQSPVEKLLLANAYIKQLLARIRTALKAATPAKQGVIRQAITKIQLRAEAIVEHIATLAEGREKVSLNSAQTRTFLAGKEGKAPSRRDAIRALRRAEKLCPALMCDHTPGDGRQTVRLIATAKDLLSVSLGNSLPGEYS